MFSKVVASLLLVSSLVGSVVSTPVPVVTNNVARTNDISFNKWGGFNSLDRFDDFFGFGNFDGRRNVQTIFERDVQVCRAVGINVVQQRLLVLQELARRVISELVCDVETQVIVFEQFHNGNRRFRDDFKRSGGRRFGFDRDITGHFNRIFDSRGSLTFDDFGFNGRNAGSKTVVFGGTNWDDNRSPASILNAFNAAVGASAD